MNQERNTCAFCRADKPVLRQYLHAKNKPAVGDGFDFIYYCNECGLTEIIFPENPLQESAKVEISEPNGVETEYGKGFSDGVQEGWNAARKKIEGYFNPSHA